MHAKPAQNARAHTHAHTHAHTRTRAHTPASYVASLYASRHPDAVDRIFLLSPAFRPRTALAALAAPRWTAEFLTSKRIEYALLRDLKRDGLLEGSSSIAEFATRQFDATFRWEDAEWFRSQWDGPVALKGVLRADDARRARDAGYDAVWVTSHGARQLESAVAPVDALPSIRRALGDEAEIIYDGGVMRGGHVVKAAPSYSHSSATRKRPATASCWTGL